MEKFMRNKDNTFTYNNDGSLLFYGKDKQADSLKRKYPPQALGFDFEYQEDPIDPSNTNLGIKERAARG